MRGLSGKLLIFGAFVIVCITLIAQQYLEYQSSFKRIQPYHRPYNTSESTTQVTTQQIETTLQSATDPVQPTAPVTEPVLFPIDLNTATAEQLCTIPGIGEVTAASILTYREEIGEFTSRQQLLQVAGIGETTLASIMPYLFIKNETAMETQQPSEAFAPPETEPAVEPTTEPVIPIIDLNTATKEELMLLPGCDSELADNILAHRDGIHVFYNTLELTYAEGVTTELYVQWKPYLSVGDADWFSREDSTNS